MSLKGIVRRIDELGRIVIPKGIRRAMHLREGDEMEIVADGNKLVLRKYSDFENFSGAARTVAQMIGDYVKGCEAIVTTVDQAVASSCKDKYNCAVPCEALSKVISSRSSVTLSATDISEPFADIKAEGTLVVEPVVVRGDLVGAVVVICPSMPDENALGYIRFSAAMLTAVLAE